MNGSLSVLPPERRHSVSGPNPASVVPGRDLGEEMLREGLVHNLDVPPVGSRTLAATVWATPRRC